jgi:type IV pilus assembly protein PilE
MRQHGFSLVELMIAVMIVGILAGFAVPSYLESTRKANRVNAKKAVLEAVARQETYRAQTLGYGRDMINLGYSTNPYVTPDGLYSVAVTSALPATGRATSFTITATALGEQVKDSCDGFALDNIGNKTVSEGSVVDCW